MSGREFGYPLEDGERLRHVPELKVGRDPTAIHLAGNPRALKNRLQLRPEHESVWGLAIVERFDSQPVAGEKQRASRSIPYGKGEHSAQLVDAGLAVVLVQVNEHLRI